MSRLLFIAALIIGAIAIGWISTIFMGTDTLALIVTLIIGGVYAIGFIELFNYRKATDSLDKALSKIADDISDLGVWINQLDASLHNAVRLRIESDRVGLPSPVLTPYLVGLLVMLGLLGTFVGMVDTLQGAVSALEGSTELQAIREGLAAPINGLSLAFGTSVAGVAASAMLGLASTLSRRDRISATRLLDSNISTNFRHFSLTHNRQQTYNAMQAQAEVLPNLAGQLQAVADGLNNMADNLSEKLLANQDAFHQSVTTAYTELAASVDKSLTESLAESGRQVGESIKPLVVETMAEISKEAKNSQQHLTATAEQQLQTIASNLANTSTEVSTAWQAGLTAQQESNTNLIKELGEASQTTITTFETAADERQQKTEQAFAQLQQNAAQQLVEAAQTIKGELCEISDNQQQAFSTATTSFTAMAEKLSEQWQQTGTTITELSGKLGEEMAGLRDAEDQRASAALERLQGMETTFAEHISNLGNELVEPMTKLIETASETPKAAAEVIEKLRVEISNNIERDNDLLAERKTMMAELATLSSSLNDAAAQQRDAVEQLVTASTTKLSEIGTQFTSHVDGELEKISNASDQFASSAVEMASLGESFNTAIQLYSETNSELVTQLNRIETTMEQSNTRSDEQMSYYVAQAREIIDHSLLSQKEVLDQMRKLSEAS